MRLTKKQQADLESILWFKPENMPAPSGSDIEDFFAFSDKGIRPTITTPGFRSLLEGKRRRGIHIAMYEEGVLDTMPYYVILGGLSKAEIMPRSVVDFLKAEMFKGEDADLIERTYQKVLWRWAPFYKKIIKRLYGYIQTKLRTA